MGMKGIYYLDVEQLSQDILQSWMNLHKPKPWSDSMGGGHR